MSNGGGYNECGTCEMYCELRYARGFLSRLIYDLFKPKCPYYKRKDV